MAKDIVTAVRVETADAEKTIKQLKDEIKNYKKALESAVIGSAEFSTATQQLNDAQEELSRVLSLTKKSVENADGSYNALVATMAELKKEWRATNDVAKRDEIGKQIDAINTELKKLDSSIGNNQRNVGNYRQDFVDAMTEMQQSTFDYGKELSQANKNSEVTRNTLEGLSQVASGVASGFAAFQGVTALLGIENENLEKSLVKVQSAMAIAQGLGGMKGLVEGADKLVTAFKASKMASQAMETQTNATTVAMTTSATATNVASGALKAFKATLASTGIGLLVVALGTLVGYLITLAEEAFNAKNEMDDLTDSFDKFQKKMSERENQQNFNLRLMGAGGASDKDVLEKTLQYAKENKENSIKQQQIILDKFGKDSEEYKQISEEVKKYTDAVRKANEELTVYNTKTLYENKQAKKKTREENERISREQQEQAKKDAEKLQQEIEIDLKEGKDRELAILKKSYEEKKKVLEAGNKDTADLDNLYKKQQEDIENKYASQTILNGLSSGINATKNNQTDEERRINNSYAIKMSEATNPVDAIQLEIDKTKELQATREEAFNKQMQQIQDVLEAEKKKDTLTSEQEQQLLQQYTEIQNQKVAETENANTQIVQLEKQKNELIKLSNEDLKNMIVDTISTAFSSASQILNSIADSVDATTKEGFETSKKMRIASATMSTLDGIISAWVSALAPGHLPVPFNYIMAGLMSATTATLGATQIANIEKQTFDGGGSSNINASAIPNVSMANSIPIAYTRELLTDTETIDMNNAQKVYVVESDITETQRDVEVKENNATF